METRNENAETVVGIFEKSIECAKWLENAAESADSPSLKRYFIYKYTEENKFAEVLRLELLKNDTSFDQSLNSNSENILGDFHKICLDIKSYFSATSDESMLEEFKISEAVTLEEFDEVLNEEYLQLELRNILRLKFKVIKNDFENIKTLEDVENQFK